MTVFSSSAVYLILFFIVIALSPPSLPLYSRSREELAAALPPPPSPPPHIRTHTPPHCSLSPSPSRLLHINKDDISYSLLWLRHGWYTHTLWGWNRLFAAMCSGFLRFCYLSAVCMCVCVHEKHRQILYSQGEIEEIGHVCVVYNPAGAKSTKRRFFLNEQWNKRNKERRDVDCKGRS